MKVLLVDATAPALSVTVRLTVMDPAAVVASETVGPLNDVKLPMEAPEVILH